MRGVAEGFARPMPTMLQDLKNDPNNGIGS